jgi:hypothetical protein
MGILQKISQGLYQTSKKKSIPIICSQVAPFLKIYTDEHKSYISLSKHQYLHSSVCHKYQFITEDAINTQAIESFHNEMKLEIKRRKGIKTNQREEFLKEFCFYLNNRKQF